MQVYPNAPTLDELTAMAKALAHDPEVIEAEIKYTALRLGGAFSVRQMLALADDLEQSLRSIR
jgi:hypothetical protein